MLVLSRRKGEKIHIGNDIVVAVVETGNDKIRIGVKAPENVTIVRAELEPYRETGKIPGVHFNKDNNYETFCR